MSDENNRDGNRIAIGRRILVNATWDHEAGVWVAESDDLPLVTEAPTMDALMAKLPGILQDLLEDAADHETEVPFELVTHSFSSVRVRARNV